MQNAIYGALLRRAAIGFALALCSQTVLAMAAPVGDPVDKLSSRLALLSQASVSHNDATTLADRLDLPMSGPGSLVVDTHGALTVNIRVAHVDAAMQAALESAGARITFASAPYRTFVARVAPSQLLNIAGIAGVENIREEYRPLVHSMANASVSAPRPTAECGSGLVSEGAEQLGVAQARQAYQVTGAGITVGVLSDTFADVTFPTSAAQDIKIGDLPGAENPCGRTTAVQVLPQKNASAFPGSDEGRAMLHIVHDLAPDAQLAFSTAYETELMFADNIRRLYTEAGADILVDDITYFVEPMFQDGPITQAIADVTGAGALYFTAAGNSTLRDNAGNNVSAYEAPAYRPTTCATIRDQRGIPALYALDCHNFNPSGTSNKSGLVLAPGGFVTVIFQWAEPRNGVVTDLDLYITNTDEQLLAAGTDTNNTTIGTQLPFEVVSYRNSTGADQPISLIIGRASGNAPRLKYVFIQGSGIESTQFNASNSTDIFGQTIFGHAGAAQAISTAAVPFNDPSTPEPFSSYGPFTTYFGPAVGTTPATALPSPITQRKPDVAATDGNRNAFFGERDGSVYRFYGTSAAAPHGAAVAALLLQYARTHDRMLVQPMLETILEASATPVERGSVDVSGSGLINAERALALMTQQAPVQRLYLPYLGR